MLDGLSISHTSGLILWSRSYTASSSSSSAQPLNSLVQEVLLSSSGTTQEGETNRYDKDAQSLMWTLANDLGLIFVVVWPRILHLTYLEKLLDSMKTLFCETYGDLVRKITSGDTSSVKLPEDGNWSKLWKGWDAIVSKLVKELEDEAARQGRKQGSKTSIQDSHGTNGVSSPGGSEDKDAATSPTLSPKAGTDAEAIARNIAALKARNKGRLSPSPRAVGGKKAKGGVSSASEASDSEAVPKRSNTPSKLARKWDDNGKVNEKDVAALDYSSQDLANELEEANLDALVDEKALGKRGEDGLYEVADYNDQGEDADEDSVLASLTASKLSTKAKAEDRPKSAFSSFFSRLSTSAGFASKTLTTEDLKPVLNAMREHLMNKNVARDIADQICESVGQSLVGKKTSGFGDGGVKAEVRRALEESLTRILTSKTSTDILLDISRKKQSSGAGSGLNGEYRKPYVITFVGVNGVGKSTNLSKVAFWLLQNKLRVLIAACDTFRSGAVEQLRVHVRNLSKLKLLQEAEENGRAQVELYERGYGKDAAGIAKDAIGYAAVNGFDVVLVDTAGRMQDNEPLMRALAKLVSVNQPDKIFFVGEAVTGNEAVDQLTKFNRSLKDFSGVSNAKARGIDGMILTKMDIIDDKVGAALSMTYVTGQPIVFIGTGQTYTDLRAMKVSHVVNALMRN